MRKAINCCKKRGDSLDSFPFHTHTHTQLCNPYPAAAAVRRSRRPTPAAVPTPATVRRSFVPSFSFSEYSVGAVQGAVDEPRALAVLSPYMLCTWLRPARERDALDQTTIATLEMQWRKHGRIFVHAHFLLPLGLGESSLPFLDFALRAQPCFFLATH